MKTVELGEVANFVRGITFKPADTVKLGDDGSVACMRTKNVQASLDTDDVLAVPTRFVRRDEQYLQPGDTLVSSANSWNLLGKCSWVPELPWKSSFGGFVTVLRPSGDQLDRRYLYRWFSYGRTQHTLRSFGRKTTNISNLPLDRCRRMEIPLPSVEDQRRIAAALDAADRIRVNRRRALAKLDTLAQAVFVDMFGDPRESATGWPIVELDELCPSHLGKMLDQKQQTGTQARPYLRNQNVRWFEFELDDLATMDFDEKARSKYRLDPGDVLICEGGEPGRAAIWRGELTECYFQKALHRGRPVAGRATAEYIVHLLRWLADNGALVDHISTATIAHLTGKRLKAMRVAAPDYALQQEFTKAVAAIDEKRRLQECSLAELDTLFASLQQRAFQGDL